ncbi:MAG: FKBP-type peptidyl-prolyl cis-trans isomerase [Prevotella sp.]|nr:FKBP-type peptidyl-prolyl cis-trans isomerase [Prevotella sp.]
MTEKIKFVLHRAAGILSLSGLLLSSGILSSCSEDKDTVEEFANWQSANDTYWSSLYKTTQQKIASGDNSWKMILNYTFQNQSSPSGAAISYRPENYVIVHVEESGTGTKSPLYSDSVAVHYQGRMIPSATYTAGLIFDTSWAGDTFNAAISRPAHLYAGGVVDGFSTALQQMHKGDHWTVYVPYQLGYGATAKGSVQAYSTLIFDLRLADFARAGRRLSD